jgi:hypothetical protein
MDVYGMCCGVVWCGLVRCGAFAFAIGLAFAFAFAFAFGCALVLALAFAFVCVCAVCSPCLHLKHAALSQCLSHALQLPSFSFSLSFKHLQP